jgi:hypothetical protein
VEQAGKPVFLPRYQNLMTLRGTGRKACFSKNQTF